MIYKSIGGSLTISIMVYSHLGGSPELKDKLFMRVFNLIVIGITQKIKNKLYNISVW